jgi:hypothetical protein
VLNGNANAINKKTIPKETSLEIDQLSIFSWNSDCVDVCCLVVFSKSVY